MKRLLPVISSLLFLQTICNAQISRVIDSLRNVTANASSDSVKVVSLGQLAEYYFLYKLDKKADSCIQLQMTIAELSNNNNLMVEALFGEAIRNVSSSISQETQEKIISHIQKGIDYAQSKNEYDYIALAYVRMSFIQLKNAKTEKALNYAIQALTAEHNVASDSLRSVIFMQLGDVYLAKSETKDAFLNCANAFDIAQKINNFHLQARVLHQFSEIYKSLNDDASAYEFLKQSLALNTENKYPKGMVEDYYDIVRLKDDPMIANKALDLCRQYGLVKQMIQLKRVLFNVYVASQKYKDYRKALQYLNSDPELKASYLNTSTSHYYLTIGNIYRYSDLADSAIFYYNLAKPEILKSYGAPLRSAIFSELAYCFSVKHQYDSAIYYYEKALEIGKLSADASRIESISDSLSNMYAMNGNYKLSYDYLKLSKRYKDSLKLMANDKDIALLQVDHQRKLHDIQVQAELDHAIKLRNLQYMAITIAITVVFIVFLFLGMFPISKVTIRIFGYFFFISLFEFIVLLIDNFLGKITNHQPLKLWLIKIFLIALLVPLQHFLEHGLIKFLSSRKLFEARQKISIKKWWKTVQKPVPPKETDIEEGTAVL